MVPLMSESMERRLDVFEYLELKLHLLVCTWCALYLKQIKLLGRVLRLTVTEPPDSVLTPAARQRIAESFERLPKRKP